MVDYFRKMAQSENIKAVLDSAERLERTFIQGTTVSEYIIVSAFLDDKRGHWQVIFETPIGYVFVLAGDKKFNKASIITEPKSERLKDQNLNEEEKRAKVKSARNKFLIDFQDINVLKKVKEFFSKDPIMQNTPATADIDGDKMADKILEIIQEQRKVCRDYYKNYSFLWKDTPFENGLALAEAVRKVAAAE